MGCPDIRRTAPYGELERPPVEFLSGPGRTALPLNLTAPMGVWRTRTGEDLFRGRLPVPPGFARDNFA